MALAIVTGFVVDDAIVVIENIARYLEAGDSPMQAALKGSKEIGPTVLSMSISLISVFIPILLMGGIVGRLFREFAVTLSIAIAVSLCVSLTATPMMCARFLKSPKDVKHGRMFVLGERIFDRLLRAYGGGLRWVLSHQPIMLGVTIASDLPQRLFVHYRSQGFLSTAGHGAAERLDHRRAGHLLSRNDGQS